MTSPRVEEDQSSKEAHSTPDQTEFHAGPQCEAYTTNQHLLPPVCFNGETVFWGNDVGKQMTLLFALLPPPPTLGSGCHSRFGLLLSAVLDSLFAWPTPHE